MDFITISYMNNITAAWAVDREFVHIVGPWGVFGVPLAAFGMTLGSLCLPLAPFGACLGRLWEPLAAFGLTLASFQLLWGALGLPFAVHWVPLAVLGGVEIP